jgi:succinate dehydrogenase/fumarate reductase-like Fe-S protein
MTSDDPGPKMIAGQLHALALLAWAFVLRLLKNAFGRGPRGLALFRANFEAEGLSSTSADEREALSSFSRCIACGRCNAGDGIRIARSQGAYPGTMQLVLASSRSLPDASRAEKALQWITADELAAKEKLCPTAVSLHDLAAFMRRHATAQHAEEPPSSET